MGLSLCEVCGCLIIMFLRILETNKKNIKSATLASDELRNQMNKSIIWLKRNRTNKTAYWQNGMNFVYLLKSLYLSNHHIYFTICDV